MKEVNERDKREQRWEEEGGRVAEAVESERTNRKRETGNERERKVGDEEDCDQPRRFQYKNNSSN